MKKSFWEIFIPLSLSVLVLFFLFKSETGINSEAEPFFRSLNRKKSTQKVIEEISEEDIKFSELKEKIISEEGIYSLYIKNMIDYKVYEFNPEEQFYLLSLFKIPIAYIVTRDVEKGNLNWEDRIEYKREDYFNNFGTISSLGFGTEFSLQKLIELMLRESDNTAPNMIKRELGEEYLNNEFKKITGDKNADLFDEYLLTDIKKCSIQWEGIFYKKWLNDENVNLLLSFLNPTSYDESLTPYLGEDLIFYHKVGIAPGLYHNCGIIRGENKDLILCLMSKDITDESFDKVNQYVAEFVNEL